MHPPLMLRASGSRIQESIPNRTPPRLHPPKTGGLQAVRRTGLECPMKPTPKDQPQTSEVHETTEDASISPARRENLPPPKKNQYDPTARPGTDKSFEEREKA